MLASLIVRASVERRPLHQRCLSDNFLITAVRQLIEQDLNSYDSIQAHVPSKKGKSRLQAPNYPAILRTLAIYFGGVYIILDALDESTEEEVFFKGFQDILSSQPNTKPFKNLITSRHSLKTERLLSHLALSMVSLNEKTGPDIVKFISRDRKQGPFSQTQAPKSSSGITHPKCFN